MANWCFQNLLISGSLRERKKLVARLGATDEMRFANLLPEPAPDEDDDEPTLVDDEYRLTDIQVYWDNINSTTNIYYESAWSPALNMVRQLSEHYPTLTFGVYYSEESQDFVGWHFYHGGFVVESDSYSVDCLLDEGMAQLHELYEAGDICDDEWYDATSEWYNRLVERAGDECHACISQYAKWLKAETRRLAQGKPSRDFFFDL